MKGLGIPSLGGLVDVYDAIVAPFTPGSPASRDPKSGKAVPPSSSRQIGTPGSVNMDSERARRRAGINPSALSPGEIDAIKSSRLMGPDLSALEFAPNTERDYANQASLTAADFAAAGSAGAAPGCSSSAAAACCAGLPACRESGCSCRCRPSADPHRRPPWPEACCTAFLGWCAGLVSRSAGRSHRPAVSPLALHSFGTK